MTAANLLSAASVYDATIIALCADGRENPTRELPSEICTHRKSCTQSFIIIIVQNTQNGYEKTVIVRF